MTAVTRPLLLSLLLAVSLHAQDAASVAKMVNDTAIDPAVLAKSLVSADALTRATAARVALVRNVAIVPALHAQLEKEANADAARELVRALVILGGNEDVAFAASQLGRFPATIDAAFADALTRSSRDAAPYREQLRAAPHPVYSYGKGTPGDLRGTATPVKAPEFAVPLVLPRGLAAAILKSNRCHSGWVGVSNITRDAAGRVQDVDTKAVYTDGSCTKAFRTIARLALAEPGPPATTPLLVFRGEGTPPCFDEAAVSNVVPPFTGEPVAPKVLRHVDPRYPASVMYKRGGTFSVVAEATISSEGCVRDLRLVQQTVYPELNRAALEALSKWTFAPGTLNGVPVDVLFNLTINFHH